MSKTLEKFKEEKGLFEEAQSKTISMTSSHNNSILTSKEKKYDPNEIVIQEQKIESPQYQEEENTYEVLKPITKQIMELPIQVKKKIKTTKTVYRKEIVVSNDEELNKILQGEDLFEEVPLPTKSTIQNLIKDSVILSNDTINNNTVNSSIKSNPNNNYSYMTKNENKYNSKYDNQNIPKTYSPYNNNIINQPKANKEIIPEEKIVYKNKNYIETYFHDDDIPQPTVCEGNALVFSKMKESNMTQEENTNKSMQSFNSGDNVNNLLDELPVEQTVLLSKQPKIDMSKVQKDNMLHKSFTSENSKSIQESINSNNYPSKEKVFRSQVLNYNYNNMNNKNDIKKLKYSLTNPLPEMDNDINNNNNINYGTQIKNNKIQPLMELNKKNKNNKISSTNINNNYNNNFNNKTTVSKSSFPMKTSGGSFMPTTLIPENPFQNNTKIDYSSNK
jgi:hypothetical protein